MNENLKQDASPKMHWEQKSQIERTSPTHQLEQAHQIQHQQHQLSQVHSPPEHTRSVITSRRRMCEINLAGQIVEAEAHSPIESQGPPAYSEEQQHYQIQVQSHHSPVHDQQSQHVIYATSAVQDLKNDVNESTIQISNVDEPPRYVFFLFL